MLVLLYNVNQIYVYIYISFVFALQPVITTVPIKIMLK